jgi:hypothetical protein
VSLQATVQPNRECGIFTLLKPSLFDCFAFDIPRAASPSVVDRTGRRVVVPFASRSAIPTPSSVQLYTGHRRGLGGALLISRGSLRLTPLLPALAFFSGALQFELRRRPRTLGCPLGGVALL